MSLLASWTEYEGYNWEKQHDDDENEGNWAGNDIKWIFLFSSCFGIYLRLGWVLSLSLYLLFLAIWARGGLFE